MSSDDVSVFTDRLNSNPTKVIEKLLNNHNVSSFYPIKHTIAKWLHYAVIRVTEKRMDRSMD